MSDRSRLSSGEAFPLQRVALVGAGRVASAFGRALLARGHRIASVTSPSTAERSAGVLGAVAGPIARDADLIVVCVPDDRLVEVVASIGPTGAFVVHTSGRFGAAILRGCGSNVAAIHPARPIPDADVSFDDVAFGVTCVDEVWQRASSLVRELGGIAVRVAEEDRVLYHAGLVMASNFTVGLAADAMSLSGREVVLPLLRATLENLERLDPDDALTGPIVRGDAGTIEAHLHAIDARAPHLRDAYLANAKRLVTRAREAGRLDAVAAARIGEMLR